MAAAAGRGGGRRAGLDCVGGCMHVKQNKFLTLPLLPLVYSSVCRIRHFFRLQCQNRNILLFFFSRFNNWSFP